MRILIIHPGIRQGGAEDIIVNLTYYLKKRGHQPVLITLFVNSTNMSPLVRKIDYIIPPKNISYFCYRSKWVRILFCLPILWFLARRYVKDADIISCHTSPAHWVGALIKKNKPVIWSCYEPPLPLSFKWVRKIGIAEWILSKISLSYIDKYVVRKKVDKIIVLDTKGRERVNSRYMMDSCIINPPIDYDFFSKGSKESVINKYHFGNNFILISVSRLGHKKNHIMPILAVDLIKKEIPSVKLVIVGTGPLMNDLKLTVKKLGIADKVVFTGHITAEELRDLYCICNLNLFPALGQSWGLPIFEAAAAGKLSIVNSDCGAAEIVKKNDIGIVTRPDPEEFAKNIIEVYRSTEIYSEKAKRAQEYVKNNMSWNAYIDKWLEEIKIK